MLLYLALKSEIHFFTSKDSNEFTSFHQYNRIRIKHWKNYLTSASVPFVKER